MRVQPNNLNGAQTVTAVNIAADPKEGKPGLTTQAHGRAVSGTGGTGFGIAVRARAFVRCRDKHVFQALMCAYVCHTRQF